MDQFPTGATTAVMEAVATRIAPLGWHLEINIARPKTGWSSSRDCDACRCRSSSIIWGGRAAEAGIDQPGFKVVRRLLTERDDCWTKISSFYRLSDAGPPEYADMRPFVQAVLNERGDRCVWGTNWPHPGLTHFMPNDADLLDVLESWIPRDNMRVPLFAANAATLSILLRRKRSALLRPNLRRLRAWSCSSLRSRRFPLEMNDSASTSACANSGTRMLSRGIQPFRSTSSKSASFGMKCVSPGCGPSWWPPHAAVRRGRYSTACTKGRMSQYSGGPASDRR